MRRIMFLMVMAAMAVPAPAQARLQTVVADTVAGKAGNRQAKPATAVNRRIENRIRSRLSNRIDPNYDPRASSSAAFEDASAAARTKPH